MTPMGCWLIQLLHWELTFGEMANWFLRPRIGFESGQSLSPSARPYGMQHSRLGSWNAGGLMKLSAICRPYDSSRTALLYVYWRAAVEDDFPRLKANTRFTKSIVKSRNKMGRCLFTVQKASLKIAKKHQAISIFSYCLLHGNTNSRSKQHHPLSLAENADLGLRKDNLGSMQLLRWNEGRHVPNFCYALCKWWLLREPPELLWKPTAVCSYFPDNPSPRDFCALGSPSVDV